MKTVPAVALLLLVVSGFAAFTANADTVDVKYVGKVDLSDFDCESITRSSFIRYTCYDSRTSRSVVQLNSTWYQYCGVPDSEYDRWLDAESMGRYFNANIKRQYGC